MLPIESIKTDVCQKLTTHDLIVSAATGSGKSTYLPIWASTLGKVLVIEPRRIACTALAEFVSQLQQSPLGKKVGYAIRFEQHFEHDTEIIFATPGVALKWLFENQLADFACVMIDEFHERRWDTDLLLALLKKRQKHRLIVTSATLNCEALSRYMNAPIISAAGRQYDVEEHYIATDMRQMPDAKNLEQRISQAVSQALAKQSGDLLIFLPGKKEIQSVASYLNKELNAENENPPLLIIPLHANSSAEIQRQALSSGAITRIVLATNVAETSLTIPNVGCVIDSGLERRTHLRGGRTVLGLSSISKSSAEQRKGRAGRVMMGHCYRLYGQFAPLQSHTPAQILRESLYEMLLACACAGESIEQLTFLDPLPTASLELAYYNLTRIKALDEQGLVTDHGKAIFPLPLDSLLAHLLVSMPDSATQQAMCDLAAALSVKQALYTLPKSADARQELANQFPEHCDLTLLIAAVRGQLNQLSLNKAPLSEAKTYAEKLRALFKLTPLSKPSSYRRHDLITAIVRAEPDLAIVQRERNPETFANQHVEVNISDHSWFIDKCQRTSGSKPIAALMLGSHAFPGRGIKQMRTIAHCLAPLPLSTLIENPLATQQLGQVYFEQDCIEIEVEHRYANRVIGLEKQPASGELLHQAIAKLIQQEQLYPDFYPQFCQRIEIEQLYFKIALKQDVAIEPQVLLLNKIKALGIETCEDLSLIEAKDLEFKHKHPERLAEFVSMYPIEIKLPELHMKTEFQHHKKTALLTYQSGNRKTPPQRWELAKFPGWRLRYKKASKVVDIT